MAYKQITTTNTNTINTTNGNSSGYNIPTYTTSSTNNIVTQILCIMIFITALQLFLYMPHSAEAVPLFTGGALNIEYRRYCSSKLSNTIDLICGGHTNTLGRRFPDSVGSGTRALKRFAPDEIFYRPTHSGPIHECCRRPCGYSELKKYCAD